MYRFYCLLYCYKTFGIRARIFRFFFLEIIFWQFVRLDGVSQLLYQNDRLNQMCDACIDCYLRKNKRKMFNELNCYVCARDSHIISPQSKNAIAFNAFHALALLIESFFMRHRGIT